MTITRRIAFTLTLVTLAACGGGGGGGAGNSTSAATPAPATATLGCAADLSVRLGAGSSLSGNLINNAWNARAAGGFAWSQCLQERRLGDSLAEAGWTWRWPDNGTQVYSYPSIVIGAKPWDGGPGNDPRFPRRVADTPRLWVDYEVDTTATGNVNLATSIWFTRSVATPAVPAENEISAEIMVWSDYTPALISNDGPVTERGEITIDGRTWRVFAAENWGDVSGGTTHRWTFIVYVARQTTRTLSFDARRFMDDAIARGLLDPSHAVANVELGNEISSGSGTTWVRRFTVTTP
jgi:Glycosyl hydrolase family 12